MGDLGDAPTRYAAALTRVIELQTQICDLHPFLSERFPIVLVEANTFLIFDPEPGGPGYRFVRATPAPMPIPDQRLRAAFPLDAHGGRACCVVTGDVFATLEGYVEIFHEFVHCRQWEDGEQALRATLGPARKAQAEQDPMWEITYPFPTTAPAFADGYARALAALERGEIDGALAIRRELRQALTELDWDYMTWQEWKEGLARLIENRIRRSLHLPENHAGRTPPFERVSFYAGGALLIAALAAQNPALLTDLPALFAAIHAGAA